MDRLPLFCKFNGEYQDTAEVWIDSHVNGIEHKFTRIRG